MRYLIRLTESDLHRIVENAVRRTLTEGLGEAAKGPATFDESILDGVTDMDLPSLRMFLKNMIGTINSRKTPYGPVRRLAEFFRKAGENLHAVNYAGIGANEIMQKVYKDDPVIEKKAVDLYTKDAQLASVVSGKDRINGSKIELLQKVSWIIDDIITDVNTIIVRAQTSKIINMYSDSEVFTGSQDRKRVGLFTLLFKAGQSLENIQSVIKKLQAIMGIAN